MKAQQSLTAMVSLLVAISQWCHADIALCDLMKTCQDASSCPAMQEMPPATFSVLYVTTKGNFTIDVTTAWAPPYAQRMWALARISYMKGASFYRVDKNATDGFVVQVFMNQLNCHPKSLSLALSRSFSLSLSLSQHRHLSY